MAATIIMKRPTASRQANRIKSPSKETGPEIPDRNKKQGHKKAPEK